MAHVILGLLMLWPQSLYELTKSFEAGVSLFYSASTGSIKRALDQLLTSGHIEAEASTGPRGKKVYSITESGRDEFHAWMLEEITGNNYEVGALSRSYFLGLLDPSDRPTVARNIERRIREDHDNLAKAEVEISALEVPEQYADVAKYQMATLQYGLATTRTALAWVEQHLPPEE
ncbi:PadR family transcriptional regulator [Gulosibacter molinativorax]|uniref:PadR family transcriptional regulator n=1 Tax=Gulosibacter molinativorax TaxID=256821 RepID=A0ABT7C9D0_9MICO|nr:PadR family transcriptional regulator [Gulosibacter molinativorax]MDJ1371826.1 PadR family transcriptional regulator [Gulosibacter molinativorax]QUY60802.1 Transcriptional regulator, PadR family [Gulosibacter molinativorax]